MEPYKQFKQFRDATGQLSLEEFADAREVVQQLTDEYKACESVDYMDKARI